DVCLNYAKSAFPDDADAPQTLDDLTDPAFADAFVTENPETSSPGLAFLLATIAEYGPDGWQDYWTDLRDNGVEVVAGWEEAYNGSFEAGAEGADRSIVTSYASSPVADVVYSDPPRDEPAIGVVADACFRQVELAGVLRGTDEPEAAARLVDFLLSPTFQEDIPLNMFVTPVNETAELPPEYTAHSTEIAEPLTLTPAEIEAGRDTWTERWTEIVLR
ncbi:MAG TPA: thiamine ABC transporter substrate-binding protein, partial [Iamia sp.]